MRSAGKLLAICLLFATPAWADDVEDTGPQVVLPESMALDPVCFDSNARIHAGDYSVNVPSYPCEVVRTYATLDRMDAEAREGFVADVSRFGLKARLVTKGIFVTLFGWIPGV